MNRQTMNLQSLFQNLEARTVFTYNGKKTPVENYITFQQRISLVRQLEFLADTTSQKHPVLYLVGIPGLNVHLEKAELQLREFNKETIHHVSEIINKQDDLFNIFGSFYELHRAVELQQKQYSKGNDKYLGNAIIHQYAAKELKKLKLPLIRTSYKTTLIKSPFNSYAIDYTKLGPDIKKHLSALYRLRRQYNMELQKELEPIGKILFKRKHIGNYYRYKGDTSELIEIAIALLETGNVEKISYEAVTAAGFFLFFCNFFGVHFSKRSNYLQSIQSKITTQTSYTREFPSLVRKFLNRNPPK